MISEVCIGKVMAYDGNGSPFMKDGGNNHILDRSKVRILLCDNNEKSSQEVSRLLCKCSYQGELSNA